MSSDDSFSSFYTQLISNDDKSNKTLRFFERKQGDAYYTVHGDDSLYVADQYYSTRDVVKTSGSPPLSYVNVSNAKLIRIIKHLLTETSSSSNYQTVEILAKDTRGVFRVVKTGTRSKLTQFEGMFDGIPSDAVVMAIKLVIKDKTRHLGVAFADATNRTLEIAEFDDTERFANLEAIIVQRGAKECLMSMDSALTPGDIHKIQAILERCDIPIKECKPQEFKSHDIQQDLGRLIKHGMEKHLSDLERTIAMSCLACLITHLNLLSDSTGFGRFTLRHVDLSQYMKLDQAAVHALNLNPTQQDSDRNMSLYGLLNKCQTHQGSRLLRQWLHQPLLDVDAINTRLNYVSLFTRETSLRERLSDQLKRVPDLDRLSKQMQKGRASLQSLYQIYVWCTRLPHMIGTLKEYEGEYATDLKRDFIEKLETISEELKNFSLMVEKTIDMDAIEKHEYRVNPVFNDTLGELSSQMDDVLTQIRDSVEGVADDLGMDASKVKLNEHKTMGYHYRVSRKDEPHLRGVSRYITLETRKDGVRFTSSKMKKLSTQYTEFQQQYEIEQLDVVKKALEIAATYSMVMEDANEILAQLDVLVALAVVAISAPTPYVRPTIKPKGSGSLHLIGCRHPCMETLDIGSFIANDVHMERGKSNVQLITGPNMGGKSTYIRQTGVVVLMAQIGSFVPCTEAEISVMDCILARVGAGDSQLKGVSTFMKEMLEASSILEAATPDSLIIIDELGRGTSTYDGFGLAWAITEHIAKTIGSFALFATHFHELTELADQLPNVINRHVTADTSNDSITMLYQVRDGPCDRSFGIYVSELAQFPTEVVQMAKRKAAELETFGSQIDIVEKKLKPTEVKMDEEGLNTDENAALDKLTAYARTIQHLPASQIQTEFRSYIDRDPTLISLAKRLGMMPA